MKLKIPASTHLPDKVVLEVKKEDYRELLDAMNEILRVLDFLRGRYGMSIEERLHYTEYVTGIQSKMLRLILVGEEE